MMDSTESIACQKCGRGKAEKRRQNTAYVEDELNFAVLCDECQKDADKYWEQRWAEYYGAACSV